MEENFEENFKENFEERKPGVSTVMGLIHHLTDLQGALNMKPNLDPQLPEQNGAPLDKVLGLLSQLGHFQQLGRTRRDLGESLASGGHLLEDLVGDDVKGLVLALVLVIAGLCFLVILLLLLLCYSCRRREPDLEEGEGGMVDVEEKEEEGRRRGRAVKRKGRERKSRERRSRERRAREENQSTSESSETSPAGLSAQYSFPPRRPLGPPIWVPPSPENLNTSGAQTPRSTGFQAIWHHSDSSGWCPGPPCGTQKMLEPTSLL